ncbi:FecR protein [Chitinophaga dinghuensis]|uniref:FecR protein n=1 Tax=Chitinophaga dinghuensis TaxID=1539050 RepID=A0A327W0R1_9BACT|nr:FecR family protein [Chitinophaga dinghuensis]RAJ81825.1 FecR protein [Chitinophaga dinghuensis]
MPIPPLSHQDQRSIDTMQHIAGLFFRRLQGVLTIAEAQELEQWLANQPEESRIAYATMTDWPSIEQSLQSLYHTDEAAALQDVWGRIHAHAPAKISSAIYDIRRYWMAAAAAAVLLIGTGTWWLHHQKKAVAPMAARYESETQPGSNKAILQLEDGSIIELDSAGKGTLAQQQAAVVMKGSNGIVSYHPVASNTTTEAVFNKITTPKGGQFQVILPDGTQVWLNAASSLRYPTAFSGNNRTVELSGEAYFDVAPSARQPFHVKVIGSRAMDIEVLGTEFNINAYEDEPSNTTTLVNGKVRVADDAHQTLLHPGQQALLYENSSPITVQPADLNGVTAWKDGLFSLQDADIHDIMRQISRWYDVDIIYEGHIQQKFVGRIPRNMKLSDVLKVLESTGWVHFTVSGRTVKVTP